MNENFSEFWWEEVTRPVKWVEDVVTNLIDSRMVILKVPLDLPWRHDMRRAINNEFKQRTMNNSVMICEIDVSDDNKNHLSPGRFLLERYGSRETRGAYRESSKITIQEYLSQMAVLKNRIVWIKGVPQDEVSQWEQFITHYRSNNIDEGLFVLEYTGANKFAPSANYTVLDFSNYASSYDVQLFCECVLANYSQYSPQWKTYISVVVSQLCDNDPEIAYELIKNTNFAEQSFLAAVKEISENKEFSRRGEETGHILYYSRHNMEERIRRVWQGQLKVLFPIIEFERVRIIEKYKTRIEDVLSNYDTYQYKDLLTSANDVELGTLSYIMNHRISYGAEDECVPDKELRERIIFLRNCRNQLAHANICSVDEVVKLLEM